MGNILSEELGEGTQDLCFGTEQRAAEATAEDWLVNKFEGHNFDVLEWGFLHEGELPVTEPNGEIWLAAGCLLECVLKPYSSLVMEQDERSFRFLFNGGRLISAKEGSKTVVH